MSFDVAVYNTNSLDGKKIINSIKAAYLYADNVRVYDFLYSTELEQKLMDKSTNYEQLMTSEVVKPVRIGIEDTQTGCRRIESINDEILRGDRFNKCCVRVAGGHYIAQVNRIDRIRQMNNNYYNKNRFMKDIKKLGIDLIAPDVDPDNLGGISMAINEFVEKCRADSGIKLFNSSLRSKATFPLTMRTSYLSEYSISKLPGFESASIDEIIDIRDELEAYVVPYRNAIAELAQEIKEVPDTESVQHECAAIYLSKIEPKVAEINEAIRDNNVFKNIAHSIFVTKVDWFDLGAIAISFAKSRDITDAIIGGTAAAVARATANGIIDTFDNEKAIQENEMYYLYEAGNILMN